MVRRVLLILTFLVSLIAVFQQGSPCVADPPMPQAPACLSWLPHGYGLTQHADNTTCSWRKGIHGFRSVPEHTGCWSHPMWGWDVNGYYRGPQVPKIDPVDCQLPIGLIYPANSPPVPPSRAASASRKVARPVSMPGAFMH